ncbi:MAG: phosphomannomutase [Microgenomates group bacterium Gr01-1014_7]|nr:MAG: phosphomannomutase [Microgenomates group bacterium Gr01-1014_7]
MTSTIPPDHIFKSYDIRGIYPDELNEKNIVRIVTAIYKFLQQKLPSKSKLKIAIGRDMRLSSPVLFEAASKTLASFGAEVIDLGLVSTPTFYFAVFKNKFDGGIQISASHNPKEYNGLKLVMASEKGILKIGKPTGMEDIKKMALEDIEIEPSGAGSITKMDGVLETEVENAMRVAGNPKIGEFKVVADAANAMGATYIDILFKKIPGNLIRMNFELDGTFPAHQPDPLQFETLKDLQKKVIDKGADLGLAPDGDGDRIFFIDDKGDIVSSSQIIALVVRELLKIHKGAKILVDLKYIFTPKKSIEEFGGELVVTKTGHAFITEAMHTNNGLFAGEASGHYYFGETGGADAPLPVIIFILSVMTRTGKKLSQLANEVKAAHESGEINFKVTNAQEIMEKLKEVYSDGQLSELDGVAINYPDWRFSLRTSNTEPLLRLNIETHIEKDVEEKKKEIVEIIEKHALLQK